MTFPSSRHAHIVGLGLIGGSVALALAEQGWNVTGSDADADVETTAQKRGVISSAKLTEAPDLIVIATPSHTVAAVATEMLRKFDHANLVVTDVAGVKHSIVEAVADPRFIGGHPMAGSEQRGLDGARSDMFRGCTWVLTPTQKTATESYSHLHGILRELGATVMGLDTLTHDRLVAMASHVPHLVAGALMNEASVMAESDGALLQLAAGGFRDMTRVAAGDPNIWPDVLIENSAAVTSHLRALRERLGRLEELISRGSRSELMADLTSAARRRRALPGRGVQNDLLTHVRVPVPDRPGVLAEITTTASDLNVNIFDIEIAHSVEGQPGVLLLAIVQDQVEILSRALSARGFRVAVESST